MQASLLINTLSSDKNTLSLLEHEHFENIVYFLRFKRKI